MKKNFFLISILLVPYLVLSQNYSEIRVPELPRGVQDYVTKNMPGGTISRAAKITENGQTVYGAVISYRDGKYSMVFDKDGNFLRKVESLSSSSLSSISKSGAVPSSSASSQPPLGTVAMKTIPESSLPAPVRKVIKETYQIYTILEAKEVPISATPVYQVILRDVKCDYVYLFNAKGDILSRRSYELKNSPFLGQFPAGK